MSAKAPAGFRWSCSASAGSDAGQGLGLPETVSTTALIRRLCYISPTLNVIQKLSKDKQYGLAVSAMRDVNFLVIL